VRASSCQDSVGVLRGRRLRNFVTPALEEDYISGAGTFELQVVCTDLDAYSRWSMDTLFKLPNVKDQSDALRFSAKKDLAENLAAYFKDAGPTVNAADCLTFIIEEQSKKLVSEEFAFSRVVRDE
jgi:hypothetical protein